MTITEPMTMLTDYVLAAAGIVFALVLPDSVARGRRSTRLWRLGFASVAAAAAIGGTYHGFALYIDAPTHLLLSRITAMMIAASVGCVAGAILSGPPNRHSPQARWLIAGGLTTAGGVALQQSGFAVATHFNHNDLYHCIQTVALYFLFRGAQTTV